MSDTTTSPGPLATDPEDVEGGAVTEPQPSAEETKSKTRQYGIYAEETVNIEDAAAALEAIKKHAVEGQTSVTILVKVGRAEAGTPRVAIQKLGGVRDLDGDYDVIAEGARSRFDSVKSKLERQVAIGGE